ncbi:MAG: AAA family ATPase [Clostridium sp.]|nr:AAA family ATPase [Clostridium sp.]
MKLTNAQQKGLKIALERYKNGEKYTTISGYAGTGKSTLVKFIISALDVEESKVAYAAYTGKAAEVLRKKGNPNAMTLHRLLYDSIPRPAGGFYRKPKTKLDYTIVVVDEVSMVPKSMIDLLLAHKVYVIFLGDPFQLPQIDKKEAHTLLDKPHIFLDEVMRQAAESEIIQTTMKIRNYENIDFNKGKEVIVIPKKELVTGHLTWADQVICGTNATRQALNNQIRGLYGFEGLPQDGEKIVIKRNYWDICNNCGDALVNGCIGTFKNPFESFRRLPSYIKNNRRDLPVIISEFVSEDGSSFGNIEFDKDFLLIEEPCIDWKVSYQLSKLKNKLGDIIPKQATYGYALTGHAAQGSQWDKVLVIEENFPFSKEEHARWLYTCCTRPSEKLVLVRS